MYRTHPSQRCAIVGLASIRFHSTPHHKPPCAPFIDVTAANNILTCGQGTILVARPTLLTSMMLFCLFMQLQDLSVFLPDLCDAQLKRKLQAMNHQPGWLFAMSPYLSSTGNFRFVSHLQPPFLPL